MFPFRFEKPRKYQEKLMFDVYNAIKERKNVLINAPTGIGKTDGVISSLARIWEEDKKKIIYLTPKISQHKQVFVAAKELNEKYDLGWKILDFIGKKHLCRNEKIKNKQNFYEICKLIKEECGFYKKAKDVPIEGNYLSVDEIPSDYCPYEVLLENLEDASFIIGDFFHVFSRKKAIFRKKLKLKDFVIVVDEAHNLPDRILTVLSKQIRRKNVEKVNAFFQGILDVFDLSVEKKSLAPLKTFSEFYFEEIKDVVEKKITEKGKIIEENLKLLSVVSFLEFLKELDEEKYLAEYDEEKISLKALDPSLLSKKIFKECQFVLMSGTLLPFEMYRDLLAVENSSFFSYPSPFPKSNQLVMVYDSISTKWKRRGEGEIKKVTAFLEDVLDLEGNILVLFPSFSYMQKIINKMGIKKQIFVIGKEDPPIKRNEIIRKFKKEKNAVLFSVLGGSVSEGVDFPGNELIGVIIVGIPFAEPTKMVNQQIKYFEEKFGKDKGWDYAYLFPAIRKVVQAAGRVIRSEKDKGFIIYADERYKNKKILQAIPEDKRPKMIYNKNYLSYFVSSIVKAN